MIDIKEKNTLICPSCSAENPQGKKFCMKCGNKLNSTDINESKHESSNDTIICPSCSAENAKGRKFCIKCGTSLTAKNTVRQNTEKSSSVPVYANKLHANVPFGDAAVSAKKKVNSKIFCAAIIAVILVFAGILLILTLNSSSHAKVTICGTKYTISKTTKDTENGAVFDDDYNKTAVSIMETVLEYIGTMPVKEMYKYIQMSDSAYDIVSKKANGQLTSDIADWREDTKDYCITGDFIRNYDGYVFCGFRHYKWDEEKMLFRHGSEVELEPPYDDGYIWKHIKNHTNLQYDELKFIIIFSASGDKCTCYVGNNNNIQAVLYNRNSSDTMGCAIAKCESVFLSKDDKNKLINFAKERKSESEPIIANSDFLYSNTETTSENIITKETTAETTATTAATVAATTETTTVSETEAVILVDYKKDYAEYLNNQTYWAGGLYIGDINGDSIPEAVIETNVCESTVILYYNEDGMQELWLGTMSDKGYVRYLPDTKQIVYSYFHFRGGAENEIYSWENTDYIKTFSMSRLAYGEGEDIPQAYINDIEADRDTFESKLLEFEKYRDEGEYFPVISVNDEDFENYVKENLPDFNNWGIVENNY